MFLNRVFRQERSKPYLFLQKIVNNFETLRQISLRGLWFYICKFEVNRDVELAAQIAGQI